MVEMSRSATSTRGVLGTAERTLTAAAIEAVEYVLPHMMRDSMAGHYESIWKGLLRLVDCIHAPWANLTPISRSILAVQDSISQAGGATAAENNDDDDDDSWLCDIDPDSFVSQSQLTSELVDFWGPLLWKKPRQQQLKHMLTEVGMKLSLAWERCFIQLSSMQAASTNAEDRQKAWNDVFRQCAASAPLIYRVSYMT